MLVGLDDVSVKLEFPERDNSKSETVRVFDPVALIISVNTCSLKVMLTVKLSEETEGLET